MLSSSHLSLSLSFFFFWINMLILLSAKAVIWDRNISSLEQKYVNNTREGKKKKAIAHTELKKTGTIFIFFKTCVTWSIY